jgi:hypothetical protein
MDTDHKSASAAPSDDVHLIVAEDEEVVIEHHPEDWIAFRAVPGRWRSSSSCSSSPATILNDSLPGPRRSRATV